MKDKPDRPFNSINELKDFISYNNLKNTRIIIEDDKWCILNISTFEDFTNQTEWSQYAKALNAEMHAQVVEPLAIDDSIVGKKVTFAGAGKTVGGTAEGA